MTTLAERVGGAAYLPKVEYRGLALGDDGLADVEFEDCVFAECTLGPATLRRVTFRTCVFQDCDLGMVKLVDCGFVECRLERCRAMGVTWAGAEHSLIAQVPFAFTDCNLDLSSFAGARVAGSVFRACSLREVDFTEADLRRVDFGGSDLARARFVRTDLREALLVDAVNVALDPRENRLQGASFSVVGALELLAPFGVLIGQESGSLPGPEAR